MGFVQTIVQRNHEFVGKGYYAGLKIIPTSKTILIGCLDPRVDPFDVLGLQPGEVAIIRNIGGRINPALVQA